MTNKPARKRLAPLDISCTSTDCENGLHCFLAMKKMGEANKGRCRECGIDLIDWTRVQRQDITDAQHTFRSMQYELIRHFFWHVPIDQKAVNYARRKGVIRLREAVEHRIRQSVGSSQPPRDGRQTPFAENPIYYAQHATASCCRKCMEEWHGIEQGRGLADSEITYLSELAMQFLTDRLPTLTQHGEHVPPIRGSK